MASVSACPTLLIMLCLSILCSTRGHMIDKNVLLRFGDQLWDGVVYIDVMTMEGEDRQYEAVCGDGFDDVDAKVVCRELGYRYGRALCCDHYGHAAGVGVTEHHVTNVTCAGPERTLRDCAMSQNIDALQACRSYAAVNCSNTAVPDVTPARKLHPAARPDVKLRFGEEATDGVVYLDIWDMPGDRHRQQFEPVCGDQYDDVDARVTCRHLGYGYGQALCCDHYGPAPEVGVTTRHVANITCSGAERSLKDCQMTSEISDLIRCQTYAAVRCGHTPLPVVTPRPGWTTPPSTATVAGPAAASKTAPNVMLKHGAGPSDGVVFLGFTVMGDFRQFEAVCGNDFDDVDAGVVCRELGHALGRAVCCDHYGVAKTLGLGPHFFAKVSCNGSEPSLDRCPMSEDLEDLRVCRYYAAVNCTGHLSADAHRQHHHVSDSRTPPHAWTPTAGAAAGIAIACVAVVVAVGAVVAGVIFWRRRKGDQAGLPSYEMQKE